MAVGLPEGPSYPRHSPQTIFSTCCPLNDSRRAAHSFSKIGCLSSPFSCLCPSLYLHSSSLELRTLCVARSLATLCLFATSGPGFGEFPGFWGSMVFRHAHIPRKGSGNNNYRLTQSIRKNHTLSWDAERERFYCSSLNGSTATWTSPALLKTIPRVCRSVTNLTHCILDSTLLMAQQQPGLTQLFLNDPWSRRSVTELMHCTLDATLAF